MKGKKKNWGTCKEYTTKIYEKGKKKDMTGKGIKNIETIKEKKKQNERKENKRVKEKKKN